MHFEIDSSAVMENIKIKSILTAFIFACFTVLELDYRLISRLYNKMHLLYVTQILRLVPFMLAVSRVLKPTLNLIIRLSISPAVPNN
jgi:hypothetical protein